MGRPKKDDKAELMISIEQFTRTRDSVSIVYLTLLRRDATLYELRCAPSQPRLHLLVLRGIEHRDSRIYRVLRARHVMSRHLATRHYRREFIFITVAHADVSVLRM